MSEGAVVIRSADGAYERLIGEDERALLARDWRRGLASLVAEASRHEEPFDVASELRELIKSGGQIVVDPARGSVRFIRGEVDDAPEARRFSLGIFHCTFDADFTNWQCGWGPG